MAHVKEREARGEEAKGNIAVAKRKLELYKFKEWLNWIK